jgi:glycosyltransferase involved in cell wall biosynthesis
MPRFAQLLISSYEARGHEVTVLSPAACFHRLAARTRFAKWAGYIDQYLMFPAGIRRLLTRMPGDTLFVFCDQALGPWVPLVKNRPHVVHTHDLLALRSALGDIVENPTGFTGRIYQRYIRRGFRQARHFISVSRKTRDDLQKFGKVRAISSDVVYNGLNFPFAPMSRETALQILTSAGFPQSPNGCILHVGGNQWYKNLAGVIAIYAQYCAKERDPLPLWCISPRPTRALAIAELAKVGARGKVEFFQHVSSATLQAAYSYAHALLFPSFAEGFGWPLIEAQACGCPVITTGEPPMTEVGGEAALYISRLQSGDDIDSWAAQGADTLIKLLSEPEEDHADRRARSLAWAATFDHDRAVDGYLRIYQGILELRAERPA